jgi:hypothetical protein
MTMNTISKDDDTCTALLLHMYYVHDRILVPAAAQAGP